jgi:hypothetical protein
MLPWVGSCHTPSIRLGWKGLPETNTSLLRKCLNYCRKKVYSAGPWAQCYKTFNGSNLRIFLICHNVCLWQAFPA